MGDVASHVTGSQGAWQELYSAQETDLRKHSDHLNGGLMAHGHLTSQSLTALTSAAQTQEALLEEQRSDMTTVVRERKDDVEAHASAFKDWSLILGTEIKQRNEDVVKFLVEDLNEDVPTGKFTLQLLTYRIVEDSMLFTSCNSNLNNNIVNNNINRIWNVARYK